MNPQERFMERVYPEPNCGCWLWSGTASGKPGAQYGRLVFKGRPILAHRRAYELFVGPIPKAKNKNEPGLILHKCNNTYCVNPDHLVLGTHRQNFDQCRNDSREIHPVGVSHGLAKLDERAIRDIRILYDRGVARPRIAKLYCMTSNGIRYGLKGGWRHV